MKNKSRIQKRQSAEKGRKEKKRKEKRRWLKFTELISRGFRRKWRRKK